MKTIVEINGRKIELDATTAQNTKLMNALRRVFKNREERVRIWYGDVKTGKSWLEEHDVMGFLSCSTGEKACLILTPRRDSWGGGAVLDHCIVRIDSTTHRQTLYKHDNFHADLTRVRTCIYDMSKADKSGKFELVARFNTEEKAQRYLDFMNGRRYNK